MINKVKWEKNLSIIDNAPRYTFEGRDPQTTQKDIGVVVYKDKEIVNSITEKEEDFYFAYVVHRPTGVFYNSKRFKYLKDAKDHALVKYNELLERAKGR